MFAHLLQKYLTTSKPPTTTAHPHMLLAAFFASPQGVRLNGARNVEYQNRVNGQRITTLEELTGQANRWSDPVNRAMGSAATLYRQDILIGEPYPLDTPDFNERNHGYFLVDVDCCVGDGLQLQETFLLHEDKGRWSLVRRTDSRVEDVRISGVGTFCFDGSGKWSLKRRKRPAWAEGLFEILVAGEEDALTLEFMEYITEALADTSFRPVFENHVFRLYTGTLYPQFEAMDPDEQKERTGDYPPIRTATEIWTLLGKRRTLVFEEEGVFAIHADACWDREHGLKVQVTNGRILP